MSSAAFSHAVSQHCVVLDNEQTCVAAISGTIIPDRAVSRCTCRRVQWFMSIRRSGSQATRLVDSDDATRLSGELRSLFRSCAAQRHVELVSYHSTTSEFAIRDSTQSKSEGCDVGAVRSVRLHDPNIPGGSSRSRVRKTGSAKLNAGRIRPPRFLCLQLAFGSIDRGCHPDHES